MFTVCPKYDLKVPTTTPKLCRATSRFYQKPAVANTDRFSWIEEREVHELNNRGRTRSLLAVVFNDRETQQVHGGR